MVPHPRPRAERIPTRIPSLPGAPRVRRVAPITAMRRPDVLRDDLRLTPVNPAPGSGMAPVWGRPVAPVTGRKAARRPGWSSKVAGGSHV